VKTLGFFVLKYLTAIGSPLKEYGQVGPTEKQILGV